MYYQSNSVRGNNRVWEGTDLIPNILALDRWSRERIRKVFGLPTRHMDTFKIVST